MGSGVATVRRGNFELICGLGGMPRHMNALWWQPTHGKLPNHPINKMRQLPGGCDTRDRVFLMSIAPDCAKRGFRANFGIWWHIAAHVRFLVVKNPVESCFNTPQTKL